MTAGDITLVCRDCGTSFSFTVGEQEFFASRGFTNQPSRCPSCRLARKASRESGGGGPSWGSGSGSYERPRREMHAIVCAHCGKDAQVPFVPRGDRPVYCSDCFESERSGGGNRGGGRGSGW